MRIMTPDKITFTARISEEELRQRLTDEVLEQIGGLTPDGARPPGVSTTCLRGEARKGGYVVSVSGPLPARLLRIDHT
jgi:hypothetical protein